MLAVMAARSSRAPVGEPPRYTRRDLNGRQDGEGVAAQLHRRAEQQWWPPSSSAQGRGAPPPLLVGHMMLLPLPACVGTGW
jgi:hypothetical protein